VFGHARRAVKGPPYRYETGSSLGLPIQMRYGWRMSFYVFGVAGLAWAAVWYAYDARFIPMTVVLLIGAVLWMNVDASRELGESREVAIVRF
jgi:hypothetical protein